MSPNRTNDCPEYESFQYLDEGSDYEKVELPEEYQWGEPYTIPLTEDEEKRVEKLIKNTLIFSIHDHPVYLPKNVISDYKQYSSAGRLWTAFDALVESPLDGVIDNMGLVHGASQTGHKMSDVLYELGTRSTDIAHQNVLKKAGSVKEIQSAYADGKIAWVPAAETARMIENELDRIEVLYGAGIRKLGITYSESNALASGLGEERDAGLTAFGYEAVERMNKIGMAIGLSHSSDQTTLDVATASEKPVFLSHNGAQSLNNRDRLDPDEALKAVADTGGVIGVSAAPHTTATYDQPRHSIHSAMEHFEYLIDLVGIDHVTLGPDTVYGDHCGLHKVYGSTVPDHIEEVKYVKGMDNPTEAWNNFLRWLVANDYSDEEIKKVTGGNTLRALDEVWV